MTSPSPSFAKSDQGKPYLCLHYAPSNDELAALMRKVAGAGYRHGEWSLTPQECLETVQKITNLTGRMETKLDMRLLVQAFHDRLQYQNGAAETHWLDLVESRMKQRAIPPKETRAQRKAREQTLAAELANLPREKRLEAWARETGKSEAAFYNRRNEAFSNILTLPPDRESKKDGNAPVAS